MTAVVSRRSSTVTDGPPPARRVVSGWVVAIVALVAVRPMADQLREFQVGPFSVPELVGALIIGCCFVPVLLGGLRASQGPVTTMLKTFALISIVWGALALLWDVAGARYAPSPDFSAMAIRLLVVLAAFTAFGELGRLRPLLVPRVLAASAVPVCVLALVQFTTGAGLPPSKYVREAGFVRIFGPFDHPNALAIFGALASTVAIAAVLASRGWDFAGALWRLVGLLCALVVLLTYARSAWFSIPAALIVMAIVARRPIVPVSAAFVGAGATTVIAGERVSTRLSGFSSFEYRLELWTALLDQVRLYDVVLGRGLGQVNQHVRETALSRGKFVNQVHNDYLRVLLETGVVGFSLYFGAIAIATWTCWRALSRRTLPLPVQRLALATIGASVVVVVVSATDSVFELAALQLVYWGLVGATLGAIEASEPRALPPKARAYPVRGSRPDQRVDRLPPPRAVAGPGGA